MDIGLPEIDRYTVAREIQRSARFPRIAMTGEAPGRVSGGGAFASAFIHFPELRKAVKWACHHGISAPPGSGKWIDVHFDPVRSAAFSRTSVSAGCGVRSDSDARSLPLGERLAQVRSLQGHSGRSQEPEVNEYRCENPRGVGGHEAPSSSQPSPTTAVLSGWSTAVAGGGLWVPDRRFTGTRRPQCRRGLARPESLVIYLLVLGSATPPPRRRPADRNAPGGDGPCATAPSRPARTCRSR